MTHAPTQAEREALPEILTHEYAIIKALTNCRDFADSDDDKSYWQHEIEAVTRDLAALHQPTTPTKVEREEIRTIFDAEMLPGMPPPWCWSKESVDVYESAFKIYLKGWQAALRQPPAPAGYTRRDVTEFLHFVMEEHPEVDGVDDWYIDRWLASRTGGG